MNIEDHFRKVPQTDEEKIAFSKAVGTGNKSYLAGCHVFFQKLQISSKIPIPGIGNDKNIMEENSKSSYMDRGSYVRASGFPDNDYIMLNVSFFF